MLQMFLWAVRKRMPHYVWQKGQNTWTEEGELG